MVSLAHNTTNDTRFDDLRKEIREDGKESGKGKDALPRVALRLTRAAADGVINLDKDSDGKDAVSKLYDDYIKSESKQAVHDKNGVKANASKWRQFVELGLNPNCDGVAVLDRAVMIRDGEFQQDAKSVKGAFPAYLDVARAQKTSDTELTDDEIRTAVRKADGKEATVEGELKRAATILDRLVTGEKGLRDNDPSITQALELVNNRLATLLQTKRDLELQAEIAARGWTVAQTSTEMTAAA